MRTTTKIAFVLAVLAFTSEARAVSTCSARIDGKTGVVKVSATGIAGASLMWGETTGGPYVNGFYQSGSAPCFAAGPSGATGVMSGCQLDEAVEDARIPTVDCMVYLKDTGAECQAHIRFCTPQQGGGQLAPENAEKLDLLADHMIVDVIGGYQTAWLREINLQVDANGVPGTGNVIVGDNACDWGLHPGGCKRDGRENLIVGDDNEWSPDFSSGDDTSYNAIVGNNNRVGGSGAAVVASYGSIARNGSLAAAGFNLNAGTDLATNGIAAADIGGVRTTSAKGARGYGCVVIAGYDGDCTADAALVAGGSGNSAEASAATVVGSMNSHANHALSTVDGRSGFTTTTVGQNVD